jgi:hypothetical protein
MIWAAPEVTDAALIYVQLAGEFPRSRSLHKVALRQDQHRVHSLVDCPFYRLLYFDCLLITSMSFFAKPVAGQAQSSMSLDFCCSIVAIDVNITWYSSDE